MKHVQLCLLVVGLVLAHGVRAAEPVVVKVWPGKVPGETGNIGPEKFVEPKAGEKSPVQRLGNVSEPTLTVYRPAADKDTGTAIVIAPGGGYSILAWEHEGEAAAKWLNTIGVTGVLFKYRVPRRDTDPKDQPPLGPFQDAQRAMSLTRSKAKEWGINPERIGMLGFSAGGHLTARTATNFDKRSYDAIDAIDQVSSRPDFAVLVYPGAIVGKEAKDQINPEIRVSKQTPPTFLVHAGNDPVHAEHSIAYFLALRKASVPAELHIYTTGGHGFGMRPSDHPIAAWPKRCEEWMAKQGLLK